MFESLLSGLVLAAVSAVTFIAYKHPHGYVKLFPHLTIAVVAVLLYIILMALLTAFSNASAITHLIGKYPESTIEIHAESIKKIELFASYALISIAIGFAVAIYLLILLYLPKYVGSKGGDDESA